MHKCDSVQFLFRQHGSLLRLAENFVARLNGLLLPRGFSASRKKNFGGSADTSAKIQLGGYRLRLGSLNFETLTRDQ